MDNSVNTKGNFQPKQSGAQTSQVSNNQSAIKAFFGSKVGKITTSVLVGISLAAAGFGGYKIYQKRKSSKAEQAPAAAEPTK